MSHIERENYYTQLTDDKLLSVTRTTILNYKTLRYRRDKSYEYEGILLLRAEMKRRFGKDRMEAECDRLLADVNAELAAGANLKRV